eukprot:4777007-Amphidinium_carterae.1
MSKEPNEHKLGRKNQNETLETATRHHSKVVNHYSPSNSQLSAKSCGQFQSTRGQPGNSDLCLAALASFVQHVSLRKEYPLQSATLTNVPHTVNLWGCASMMNQHYNMDMQELRREAGCLESDPCTEPRCSFGRELLSFDAKGPSPSW